MWKDFLDIQFTLENLFIIFYQFANYSTLLSKIDDDAKLPITARLAN